jgi:hypothetical protein
MTAAELGRRLAELWDTLEALGAVVHRRPNPTLMHGRGGGTGPLRRLVAREAERVRVLTSPEAAPVLAGRRMADAA